jgi:hypothetical protein
MVRGRAISMTIHLSAELEAALKAHASAQGLSVEVLIRQAVEQELSKTRATATAPFSTDRGIFARFGPAPSGEEIDKNRADIFANFGETFL